MSRLVDLTGKRFGKLTVIKRDGFATTKNRSLPTWLVQCDCGTVKTVKGCDLARKRGTTSCGCQSVSAPNVNLKNLTGQQFGRLAVLKKVENEKTNTSWLCKCSCGNLKEVVGNHLKAKTTTSCGCLRKEIASAQMTKHGMHKTRTYSSWSAMKNRCTCKNDPTYHRYGGRGIKVCQAWLDSFETFLADMGERPEDTTLDRKENNGDYTPDNCRWATDDIQNSNRSDCVYITHNGETLISSEWSRRLGAGGNIVANRLAAGWSEVDAVTIKPHSVSKYIAK